jgi:Flp pilus assembly protein CpaB
MLPDRLLAILRAARRRVLIHRRALAALCAAAAVLATLRAVQPPPVPTVDLWVAAHDLTAGSVVAAADLRRVASPPSVAPPSAVHDRAEILGRTLVMPVARGQPVVAVQVLGRRLLDGLPGRAVVTIRLADADVAGLIRAGDVVDLWATDPRAGGPARLLVAEAVVLGARTRAGSGPLGSAGSAGVLVLFAVPRRDVGSVASAASTDFLSVVWNR